VTANQISAHAGLPEGAPAGRCWWIGCVLLAAAAVACAALAASSPAPTATSPPLPQTARLKLFGRVLDENGAPVAGTTVGVGYQPAGGTSNPPSTCPSIGRALQFCWLVYTVRDGYESNVQWVPVGASPRVLNLKTRADRMILPGESTVVYVEPTSSLCTDREDLWALGSRCEIVIIESGPGVLRVEARAVSGKQVPLIYWYTSGNYAGLIDRQGPDIVSIPVRRGTYRILVGLPEGAPAQRFNVVTSLR